MQVRLISSQAHTSLDEVIIKLIANSLPSKLLRLPTWLILPSKPPPIWPLEYLPSFWQGAPAGWKTACCCVSYPALLRLQQREYGSPWKPPIVVLSEVIFLLAIKWDTRPRGPPRPWAGCLGLIAAPTKALMAMTAAAPLTTREISQRICCRPLIFSSPAKMPMSWDKWGFVSKRWLLGLVGAAKLQEGHHLLWFGCCHCCRGQQTQTALWVGPAPNSQQLQGDGWVSVCFLFDR